MKFLLYLIAASSIFFASCSKQEKEPNVLDEADYQLMELDSYDPAITVPGKGLEFFNEWSCYEKQYFKITTSKVDVAGLKVIPGLILKTKAQEIHFDLDHDVHWKVKDVLRYWEGLMKGQKKICIYSVHLQTQGDIELRFIERIKTMKGLWRRDDENYSIDGAY